ncbi:amino acid transporter [Purpureocillium lavendulum]|uniref:Glutathione S-transferase kappa 1 n=1 Tax=Purpureocillium lavendulum TaxID=1247861 RepID=A0AB34FPZ4_9HYPO|nr:amino acid transporter [Purpureocillium lavendulum]
MPAQGKKIEFYLDCGPYHVTVVKCSTRSQDSSFADLLCFLPSPSSDENRFIPVFLGGINVGSGNQPPWTLPAKAKYLEFDGKRAQRYFGLKFEIPDFFPILSLLPQRSLTYVKAQWPDKLEALLQSCFDSLWLQHLDLAKPANMRTALARVFGEQEAEEVLAAAQSPGVKQSLNDATKHAFQDLGAFGCPWFWVHDGKGRAEPFFGSDRFHFMWDYLEVPHRDLEILGPVSGKL